MYKIILALLTFSISLSAIARVGENRIDCIQRYGPDLKNDTLLFNPHFTIPVSHSTHSKSDIVVTVWYVDGKCICIQYLRMPEEKRKDPEWKKAEIEYLLKINGGTTEWKEIHDDGWMSSDRQLVGMKQDMTLNPDLFGGPIDQKKPTSFASCLTVTRSNYVDKMRSKETKKAQDALSEF